MASRPNRLSHRHQRHRSCGHRPPGAGTDINGVWALGRIGPDAKAALPVLESKMRQDAGRERVYAAGAVWAIGGENSEAAAIVKAALEDADAHVRTDAKNVLVESPDISSR